MVRFFTALGAKISLAVWTPDTVLSHMLGCLLGQQIALVVFLFVIHRCGRNLKNVATVALDHRILFTQVDLHPLLLDVVLVSLGTEYHPDFHFRYDRIAVSTLGLLKNRFIAL
jgi:hypothetical protein